MDYWLKGHLTIYILYNLVLKVGEKERRKNWTCCSITTQLLILYRAVCDVSFYLDEAWILWFRLMLTKSNIPNTFDQILYYTILRVNILGKTVCSQKLFIHVSYISNKLSLMSLKKEKKMLQLMQNVKTRKIEIFKFYDNVMMTRILDC